MARAKARNEDVGEEGELRVGSDGGEGWGEGATGSKRPRPSAAQDIIYIYTQIYIYIYICVCVCVSNYLIRCSWVQKKSPVLSSSVLVLGSARAWLRPVLDSS